ncbi:MAG: beta-lactamase family protein [Myxococcaceae bacterium]|nr:beta-lactamase family protein [Myxococcaceae bacterium]
MRRAASSRRSKGWWPEVSLEALLDAGVAEGVYGTARAVVLRRGATVFSGGPAEEDTLFDLASVTKVMATTAAFLSLRKAGAVSGATRLRALVPQAAADVSLEDLLFHRSGLPAFVPYFAEVLRTSPELLRGDCPRAVREAAREQVVAAAQATRPTAAPGVAAVYSDVGFILLGEALARAARQSLESLAAQVLADLGIAARYRRLSARLPVPARLAPTGARRPREPAPGQEGLWSVADAPTLPAEVDDDNAWAMDGVSGHAGLFGTAGDVARFGQHLLEGSLAPVREWRADGRTPGSTRALGFDTPSAEGASAGPRFGRGPKGAIGHLGFTGTSLWVDLDRELVVALLTNRTWQGRANVQIRAFRPRFHEAVVDLFG